MQIKLQDALNNVSTGFYASSGSIACKGSIAGPDFIGPPAPLGENKSCIFVGNAIQFNPLGSTLGSYSLYTVVGNRQNSAGDDAQSIADAKSKLLGADATDLGIVDEGELFADIDITSVKRLDSGGAATPIGGFAIVSDFSIKDAVTGAVSGNAARVSLRAIKTTGLNQTKAQFGIAFKSAHIDNLIDAPGGILICIRESGGGRKASVTIGGDKGVS